MKSLAKLLKTKQVNEKYQYFLWFKNEFVGMALYLWAEDRSWEVNRKMGRIEMGKIKGKGQKAKVKGQSNRAKGKGNRAKVKRQIMCFCCIMTFRIVFRSKHFLRQIQVLLSEKAKTPTKTTTQLI